MRHTPRARHCGLFQASHLSWLAFNPPKPKIVTRLQTCCKTLLSETQPHPLRNAQRRLTSSVYLVPAAAFYLQPKTLDRRRVEACTNRQGKRALGVQFRRHVLTGQSTHHNRLSPAKPKGIAITALPSSPACRLLFSSVPTSTPASRRTVGRPDFERPEI